MISGGIDIPKVCGSLPPDKQPACTAYASRCAELEGAKAPIILDLPNGMKTREFTLDECLTFSVEISKIFGPPPTPVPQAPASITTPEQAQQAGSWAPDGRTRIARKFRIRVSQLKASGEIAAPQIRVVRDGDMYHLDKKIGFKTIQYAINTTGDGSKKTFTYRTNWYGGSYEGVIEFGAHEKAFDFELRIQLAGELGPAQFIHIVRP